MKVLTTTGKFVRRLIRGSINRLWVQPLETFIIPSLPVEKPNRIQRLLLEISLWCAAAGRVPLEELRLLVIRWSGSDWSVIYVGNGFSAEALCHALFLDPPETRICPPAYLWQAPGLVREFTEKGDLVVCELNRTVCLFPKDVNFSFTTPQSIKQVLDGIEQPVEKIFAGFERHIRSRIRRLESHGYNVTTTHSEADFNLFYHRMYLPYVEARHAGRSALMGSYDYIRGFFEKGTLFILKQDEVPISGAICTLRGGFCSGTHMGVIDGRVELVKQDVNVALWWFIVNWAHEQGAHCFDFGGSLPMTADGAFMFKRQWGTKLIRFQENYSQWKFFGKAIPAKLRDHLNERGFISEISGAFYQVMLLDPGESVKETDLTHRLKTIAQYGLAGFVMISPGGEKSLISPMASSQYRIEPSSQDVQSAPSQ